MTYRLFNLSVMGLFSVLVSYCWGTLQPVHHTHVAAKPVPDVARPVVLYKLSMASATVTRSHSHEARLEKREHCGEDYACIIAWAAEKHSPKNIRRKS